MKKLVLYIHGKGGCAGESERYKPLFPGCEVAGLDYQTYTPWETGTEIREAVTKMNAEYDSMIRSAFFISPIVDMEKLILNMMSWANVTEKELEEKWVIPTSFGEDLSWEYLCYVREHPVCWTVPTRILYGSRDNLTSYETISAFAKIHGAELSVMEEGEHWFHTDEQMRFLDNWIKEGRSSTLQS